MLTITHICILITLLDITFSFDFNYVYIQGDIGNNSMIL